MIVITLHNDPRFSDTVRARLIGLLREQDHPSITDRVQCFDDEYHTHLFCVITKEGYEFYPTLAASVDSVRDFYSQLERLFPDAPTFIVDIANDRVIATDIVPKLRLITV